MNCVRALGLLAVLLVSACASAPGDGQVSRPLPQAMPAIAFSRALALMADGELPAAEAAFQALAKRYPGYSGPWTNLGIIAAQRGDHWAAADLFAKAIAANPDNAVAIMALGTLLYQRGDIDAALARYRQAIVIRPDYAEAHLNLAVLYDQALHQPAPALEHYRRYQQLTGDKSLLIAAWILALEKADSSTHYKMVSK